MAQTLFSSGFTSGCYFQIQQENDLVRAIVHTPVAEKETVAVDYDLAKKWVDRQVAQYLRTMSYED